MIYLLSLSLGIETIFLISCGISLKVQRNITLKVKEGIVHIIECGYMDHQPSVKKSLEKLLQETYP